MVDQKCTCGGEHRGSTWICECGIKNCQECKNNISVEQELINMVDKSKNYKFVLNKSGELSKTNFKDYNCPVCNQNPEPVVDKSKGINWREAKLIILQDLVDKIGEQVTRDYDDKHGLWEGISVSNSKSISKALELLIKLEKQQYEKS